VRRSSIVDGSLSSSFCILDWKIVILSTYVTNLISKLVVDATSLMQWFYLSLQLTAHATQDWLHATAMTFIAKREWPPNSPDLNLLDYHVWVPR